MGWNPARRGAPLAAAVALHGAAIAALVALPEMHARLVFPSALDVVLVREERPPPSPPPSPVPTPRMREPLAVVIPVPEIAIEAPPPVEMISARPAPPAVVPAVAVPAVATASSAGIEPPRFDMAYLRNPPPAHPPLSRSMKEEGRVILRVRVSARGEARDVLVGTSSGSERLDRAAVEAVRQWRFAPAQNGPEPVEAWALVPISFRLET